MKIISAAPTLDHMKLSTFFGTLGILILIGLCCMQYKEGVPHLTNGVSMTLIAIVFAIFLLFCCCCALIFRISRAKFKTKQDIILRKRLVNSLSFQLAAITSLLIVALAAADFLYVNQTNSNWISNAILSSFLLTMAIIYNDSIISKICAPIYTVEIIPELEDFNLYLRSFYSDKQDKLEFLVCQTFNHLFPTFAIGDPNSVMRPVGASRIYATDGEWRDAVSELMRRAKVIILRCNNTDGTLWELNRIFTQKDLVMKCVFLYNTAEGIAPINKLLKELGYNIQIQSPTDPAHTSCASFYRENFSIRVNTCILANDKDVAQLINTILLYRKDVDARYSEILAVRHNPLKNLYTKNIPAKIRNSLNWGFISPIYNFRHWPIYIWLLMFASCALGLFFVPLLIGNQIEWTQTSNASPEMFLRRQRREAAIMWFCVFTTALSVLLVIAMA